MNLYSLNRLTCTYTYKNRNANRCVLQLNNFRQHFMNFIVVDPYLCLQVLLFIYIEMTNDLRLIDLNIEKSYNVYVFEIQT